MGRQVKNGLKKSDIIYGQPLDDFKAYNKQVLRSEIIFEKMADDNNKSDSQRLFSYADAALEIKLRTQDTYTHV